MRRLIPQWLVKWWCRTRYDHAKQKFEAVAGVDVARETGIVQMQVETCRCGEEQNVVIVTDKVQHPRRRA